MDIPPAVEPAVTWRAAPVYSPNLSSKTGVLEETRQLLLAYRRLGDMAAARRSLVDGELPQRARATRETIVQVITQRLVRWSPPAWALDDLAAFAEDTTGSSLPSALLLHIARQDALLYDFVQQVVVPAWQAGDRILIRADVQRFLDHGLSDHPEIDGWSNATREKLAGNVLSVLRDYGLLQGSQRKQIVEPIVPEPVAAHLVRLLRAEGVADEALAEHVDWNLWLWDARRARAFVRAMAGREAMV